MTIKLKPVINDKTKWYPSILGRIWICLCNIVFHAFSDSAATENFPRRNLKLTWNNAPRSTASKFTPQLTCLDHGLLSILGVSVVKFTKSHKQNCYIYAQVFVCIHCKLQWRIHAYLLYQALMALKLVYFRLHGYDSEFQSLGKDRYRLKPKIKTKSLNFIQCESVTD